MQNTKRNLAAIVLAASALMPSAADAQQKDSAIIAQAKDIASKLKDLRAAYFHDLETNTTFTDAQKIAKYLEQNGNGKYTAIAVDDKGHQYIRVVPK